MTSTDEVGYCGICRREIHPGEPSALQGARVVCLSCVTLPDRSRDLLSAATGALTAEAEKRPLRASNLSREEVLQVQLIARRNPGLNEGFASAVDRICVAWLKSNPIPHDLGEPLHLPRRRKPGSRGN